MARNDLIICAQKIHRSCNAWTFKSHQGGPLHARKAVFTRVGRCMPGFYGRPKNLSASNIMCFSTEPNTELPAAYNIIIISISLGGETSPTSFYFTSNSNFRSRAENPKMSVILKMCSDPLIMHLHSGPKHTGHRETLQRRCSNYAFHREMRFGYSPLRMSVNRPGLTSKSIEHYCKSLLFSAAKTSVLEMHTLTS